MYCLFCVILCIVCMYMCTELLPPGGYPIAVKYIISYHIIQNCSEIISLLFTDANTYTVIGVASLQAAPFMCAPIMVYIFVSVHHILMISLHFCILELII